MSDVGSFDVSAARAESMLAIGVARLGHCIAYFTRDEADAFGRRLQQTLLCEGFPFENWTVDHDRPTRISICDAPVRHPSVSTIVEQPARHPTCRLTTPHDVFRFARICHGSGITAPLSEQAFAATGRRNRFGPAGTRSSLSSPVMPTSCYCQRRGTGHLTPHITAAVFRRPDRHNHRREGRDCRSMASMVVSSDRPAQSHGSAPDARRQRRGHYLPPPSAARQHPGQTVYLRFECRGSCLTTPA